LEDIRRAFPETTFVYLVAPHRLEEGSQQQTGVGNMVHFTPRKVEVPHKTILNFDHPDEDVIYVIGPDVQPIEVRANDVNLCIPMQNGVNDTWAVGILSVVLYDRWRCANS